MENPSVDWTRDEVRTVVDATRGVWTNGYGCLFGREKTLFPANNDLPNQVIATNVLAGLNLGGSPERYRLRSRSRNWIN